jgi:HTH-type transcriptional regulator, global nitrogen regulator NrpRI
MGDKTEKKKLLILRILQDTSRPLASAKIAQRLSAGGVDISERTVRLYLKSTDEAGLTENLGKSGRRLTDKGSQELHEARAYEKVGFLAARIDRMTYRMDFDLARKTGSVVINISVIERQQLLDNAMMIKKVFEQGYAMGSMVQLLAPGEKAGSVTIPEGMVGLGTVCSITLNGVLLHHGIPAQSRFGGLLELQNKKPTRFVEIINYDGTSLDPLEIFIRSGMTDYWGATMTGNGRIGASFRELPAESRDRVVDLAEKLVDVGLGGFMTIGWPGQPVLDIPVSEGLVGAIVIGGLNPVAILEERGIRIQSRAMAGLVEYHKLFHYSELEDRIKITKN